jgi:hypothetical protein
MLLNPQPKAMSITDRPVPVAPAIVSRQRSSRWRRTYRAKLLPLGSNSRCSWRTEIRKVQIDVALDRRELCGPQRIPALLSPLVGGATRQRHEAAEIAQHGFFEFVGKERCLRLRRVHSRAEERAERRRAGQQKWARQPASGEKRRERGLRDDQNPERGCAIRFRVELPFARAHAEIAWLMNEVDRGAAWRGLPDHRPVESANEESLSLVPADVRAGALNPLES